MNAIHPSKLLFSYGSWDFSHLVEWEGGILTIRNGAMYDKQLKTISPSVNDWTRFWKSVDDNNVWNWLPEYKNPLVLDGCQWSLELEFNGRSIISEGSNAYPGWADTPDFPDDCDFGRFLQSVVTLTDYSFD